MNNSSQKNILVTGIHRSGSTWLGRMLSLGQGMLYINEPFNVADWAYKLDGLAHYYYTYIPDLDEKKAYEAFNKVLNNKTRKVFAKKELEFWIPVLRKGRKLIKDPIAALSSEWLYQNFDLDILVLVRHPAAYVSSLKRMNWNFPFDHLLKQKKLMSQELSPLRAEIQNVGEDFIERAALSWKCIYFVLSNYIQRNNWLYKLHEDLSINPIDEFNNLYTELGIFY